MTSITEEITRLETEIALAEEEIRKVESLGKRGVNAIGRIRFVHFQYITYVLVVVFS